MTDCYIDNQRKCEITATGPFFEYCYYHSNEDYCPTTGDSQPHYSTSTDSIDWDCNPLKVFINAPEEFGYFKDPKFEHFKQSGVGKCHIYYDDVGFYKCQHGHFYGYEELEIEMCPPLDIFKDYPEEFVTGQRDLLRIYGREIKLYKKYIQKMPRNKRRDLHQVLNEIIKPRTKKNCRLQYHCSCVCANCTEKCEYFSDEWFPRFSRDVVKENENSFHDKKSHEISI